MRKRNYVMGLIGALAISIAVPAAAHASILGTTLTTTVGKTKQQKKVHGGTSLDFVIDTAHVYPDTPPQTAYASNVDLDRNFKVKGKGNRVGSCNPSKLVTALTPDQAKAACPSKSLIGSGDATTCTFATGVCGNPTQGSSTHGGFVTTFNGLSSGGVTNLLLHVDLVAGANPLVIDGKSAKSPLGSPFGTRLVFAVPDSSSTGQGLTIFHSLINQKLVNRVKNKNTGVVKKQFLVGAKCSGDKVWQFRAEFLHRNGGPTTVGTSEVPCKVKKA